MNAIIFLKAAYAVAWAIYLGYLWRILLRMKRVEKEREELERKPSTGSERPAATLKRSAL